MSLQTFLDAAPDPTLIVNRHGEITYVSATVSVLFGYTNAELISSPIELLVPDHLRQAHEAHRGIFNNKPKWCRMGQGAVVCGLHKDGTDIPLEVTLSPVEVDDELFVVCSVHDTRFRNSLLQLINSHDETLPELFLAEVPALILVLDAVGRIAQVNPIIEQVLGYRPNEVVGKDWFKTFIPQDEQRGISELFGEVMKDGNNPGHTNAVLAKDGAVRQIEWFAKVVEQPGSAVGLLNVGHDVTDRIAKEEAYEKLIQALQTAERQNNEFLALAGHEIRNPLAVIRFGIDIVRTGRTDSSSVEEACSMMERATHKISQLVSDLVDVSRIAQGRLSFEIREHPLAVIVEDATESVRPLTIKRRHQLSVELPVDPVYVHTDRMRLGQVLTNLLSNAAKYTPDGGRISISIEQSKDWICIAVCDDGAGISKADLDTIFERFRRLNLAMDADPEGMGLGLYLVKSLVEMLGGRIEAHSDGVGQGSQFRVWLPSGADPP